MARARTQNYASTAPAKSYSAPTGVAGPVGSRRATAEDFGGVGAGLVTAGKGLADFATKLHERQEQADVTRAGMMQATATADIAVLIKSARSTAAPGAPGHVDNTERIVDEYFNNEERRESITTPAGRAKYQQVMANVKSHYMVSEVGFAAEASGVHVRKQYADNLNTAKLLLRQTPTEVMLQQQVDSLTDLIQDPKGAIYNSKGLNAQDRAELLTDGIQDLTKAYIEGLIRVDPDQTLIDLEGGKFNDMVDEEDVTPLITKAKSAVRAVRLDEDLDNRLEAAKRKEDERIIEDDFLDRLAPGHEKPLTNKDVDDSTLPTRMKITLTDLIKNRANDSSPGFVIETLLKIHEGKIKSQDELMSLVGKENETGRGLNFNDFKLLRSELLGTETPDGKIEAAYLAKAVKYASTAFGASNDIMQIVNPQGDFELLAWYGPFREAWKKKRSEGIPALDLITPDNPNSLIDNIKSKSSTQIIQNMLPPSGEAGVPTLIKGVRIKANSILNDPKTGDKIYSNMIDGKEVWFYGKNDLPVPAVEKVRP